MRQSQKLSALGVKKLEPGPKDKWHLDGANLYLFVKASGGKSWVFRFMKYGAAHWLGLGSYPDTSLAEARELAATHRKAIRAGIDIAVEKKTRAATVKEARANAKTFKWCAGQYILAHKSKWSNAKSEQQWTNTLETYAGPVIGELDVSKVDTSHIVTILTPIWTTKAETASRVRGRIESVLDWAGVNKHRKGDNPARLAGHIEILLPPRNKAATVEHHAALPYADLAAFMPDLRQRDGIAARACEFAILTAARSGEVRLATWSEIDVNAGLWIIPGERMKAGREHRVPLSREALAVLETMKLVSTSGLIFPGAKDGKPLSDMSLTAVLKRMERGDLTMHGFRSTFRDWAAEVSNHPSEMAEMALAHTVSNKVEAAYRRGDMIEKRRALMQDFADFCALAQS